MKNYFILFLFRKHFHLYIKKKNRFTITYVKIKYVDNGKR